MERLARWAWRRVPGHTRAVFIAFASIIGVVLGSIGWLSIGTYLELPASVTLRALVISTGVGVSGVVVSVYAFGHSLWNRVAAWTSGDHTVAPQLFEESLDGPRRISIRASMVVTPTAAIAGAAVLVASGTPTIGVVVAALGCVVGVQVAVFIISVSADLLFRPLREELSREISPAPASDRRGLTIEGRLVGSVAAIALIAAGATPHLMLLVDTPSARLIAFLVSSMAVAITTALVFRAMSVRPVLRPIDDLTQGAVRVAAGDLSERLPITSGDELGGLVLAFNRMQEGLLERERLHRAFGSYVDPALAERLLAQGDELFSGEDVDVTVFFVDVRDFTAYSERESARQTVAQLNRLFEIVVPTLREHRGHANKFSGDGVLAVFGVPEQVLDHADRAVAAAVEIQCRVREVFGETLRIGIGVNSGRLIAGTVGGGGKLEFALIGDPVNVAARVEQLTKVTGDPILLTQSTLDVLSQAPAGLISRGAHIVKGKADAIVVYALDP